ncbi:MAG: N-carbamoylputrescine amidase [Hyphomonadaceae bacterium]|jgi:N-carbamoylputrescine amidase|uniref:N-carbamoylputrescine amidase n=1 Tax=Henriciella sp. TaxID=1968823 RepID=UPI000C10C44A|nr:N-carbamoylputrescine amidase [Henriciella sp.]MBF33864.1 N-carbamoylputrescine amidase [Hyphomonadaceae bacterium]PHR79748.1 MAG: N-carbamoylputrescine amidase [Henriciella sp.]|tara:strand:- start:3017 stop:3859 length:843 start_codon:yes stop_codon:yes gene_type:complete
MSRTVKVAALQASFSQDMQANIDKVKTLVREAAAKGAEIILPSELFCDHYFCKVQDEKFFRTAYPWTEHPAVEQLSELAGELGVVIPVSIYEKDGPEYYNSIVIIDADGTPLGVYRKSHIPDGPGYMEKFYFRPGNTGFRVWDTMKGRIGVGICWDQWFPEAARAMTLMGADILFYPTAIGSEPHDADLDTAARWRRAMQGHAVSNVIPVVAANRTGNEEGQIFYGTSFIADHAGEIADELGRDEEGVILAEFDLDFLDRHRAAWGFFRDRRTDLYEVLG